MLLFTVRGFPTAPECARVGRKFSRLLVSCVAFARRPTCQQLSPCPWRRAHRFYPNATVKQTWSKRKCANGDVDVQNGVFVSGLWKKVWPAHEATESW